MYAAHHYSQCGGIYIFWSLVQCFDLETSEGKPYYSDLRHTELIQSYSSVPPPQNGNLRIKIKGQKKDDCKIILYFSNLGNCKHVIHNYQKRQKQKAEKWLFQWVHFFF